MIEDDTLTPFEVTVATITAPAWGPIYLAWKGFKKLMEKRTNKPCASLPTMPVEVLQPQMWTPVSDLERQVFAAMILAGRPVTNAELARLMGVSPGEASKRVKALEGILQKERIGREVRIALPHYH